MENNASRVSLSSIYQKNGWLSGLAPANLGRCTDIGRKMDILPAHWGQAFFLN